MWHQLRLRSGSSTVVPHLDKHQTPLPGQDRAFPAVGPSPCYAPGLLLASPAEALMVLGIADRSQWRGPTLPK